MTATASELVPHDGGGGAGGKGQDEDFWRRDFRLLLGGSALSQLGALGAAAANPLLALALTGSPIIAGWVAAATTLPGLFLHLPVGLLVDRYDRWRIMLFSQVIRVINSILLVIGLCMIDQPWLLLVVAAVVDGSCAVFFRIAELAAVRYVVPDGEAENAMGKSEARHHLAVVLGRPVGGLLFSMGRIFPYVLDAVTSLVSVVSLLLLKTRPLQSSKSTKKPWNVSIRKATPHFKEGFRWLCHDKVIFVSLCACALANIGFQVVILLLVVEAERRQLPGSIIGAMLATSGVAGFFGALTAPGVVKFFTPAVTLKYCILSWLPLLFIVALAGNPLIGMIAWGFCSFTGAYVNVAIAIRQSTVIPCGVLGRVEGVSQFLTTGAVTLGAGGGGYVIAVLGTRLTAFLVALVFLVIVVGVFVLIRSADPIGEEKPEEAEEEKPGAAEGEESGKGELGGTAFPDESAPIDAGPVRQEPDHAAVPVYPDGAAGLAESGYASISAERERVALRS
ncbi:MAG: MFS transporter [Actinomadura sp.]